MHPVAADELETARPQIAALCQRFGVRHRWLFGSGRCDYDLLAEYDGAPEGVRELDRLTRLPEEISALLRRPVHIVNWSSARNPFFRRGAEGSRGADFAIPVAGPIWFLRQP